MKYMGSYYAQQTTHHLHVLRSQKKNRLSKLQSEASTYLNMQERKKLNEQINWIDAEIRCRADQLAMDL